MIKLHMDSIELKEILGIRNDLLMDEFKDENYDNNYNLLIMQGDDDYLNNRGENYKLDLDKDIEFKNRLGRLKFNSIKDKYILKYFNSYCYKERSKKNNSPNFIDLFCGAGGFSLGFVQEGFVPSFACDIESACIETYRFNHPNVESKYIINHDIELIKDDIYVYINNKSVDIVIGGPPCQGFSMANRQRLIDDPRNKLYKAFVEIVSLTNPKFFIMENVKGMLNVASEVCDDFKTIGYKVAYKVFNAKDFGVPQNRERLIFIGTALPIDLNNIFEAVETLIENNSLESVLWDAICDLNSLEASRKKNSTQIINQINGGIVIKKNDLGYSNSYLNIISNNNPVKEVIFNHQARYNNDRDIEIFSRLNPGDKSDDPKISDIMPYKHRNHIFKDKYYKLRGETYCKTITAHMRFDCNMYIHPTQARGLTPREAARVQSYPDDYVFKGAYTKTYMQIGNSVPPLMGRFFAKVLKLYV